MFEMASTPPIRCEAGCLDQVGAFAAQLAPAGRVLLILDPNLGRLGIPERARALLEAAGLTVRLFDAAPGEPTIADLRKTVALAREADLVVGIGGGSALDIAKISAVCGRSEPGTDPAAFSGAARPLPPVTLPKILVPTTAGAGAESSSTAIFSGENGRKLWIWGSQTKAERILLDPALTVSLPPAVTAACAMDAFVHAFEAATNRRTHSGAQLYAHEAMRLIAGALPRAVVQPTDLGARGDLLVAACYAGVAIDNCGTAVAHMVSHALAGLAPVSHGLATALAFEMTLPWLVAEPTADMDAAAQALYLPSASALPGSVAALMDRSGMVRRLPEACGAVDPAVLAEALRAPENAPMRTATARLVSDADTERFAQAMIALAASPETVH
ncbi:MAG: iron-containing alcohol dehydrogenase [Pseudomonadota bacterium]